MSKKAAADKDKEPLHVAEAYRRARRNVLFWGVATSLVALGTGTKDLELAGLVRGMSFDPELLVFTSMLILVFMAFGYWRADQEHVATNSEFNRSERLAGAADEIESLNGKIANLSSAVGGVSQKAQIAAARIDARAAEMNDTLLEVLDAVEPRRGELSATFYVDLVHELMAKADGDVDGAERIARHLQNLEVAEMKKESRLAENLRRAAKEKLASFKSDNGRQVQSVLKHKELSDTAGNLLNLSNELTSFANNVGVGTKRWFYLHDRTPAIAVTMLGLIIGTLRLGWPAKLDQWVEALF